MVKEQLTPEMINVGESLLKSIDASGLPVSAAMWLFDSDTNDWQLMIASPATAQIGQREIYRKIGEARNAIGLSSDDFPLDTVGLFDASDPILGALQTASPTGPGIWRIRLSRNAFQGHFIDDALIYRMN